eukprot:TRINITY_DN15923_c1_g1_i2.p2 TRINITY_DN15923_c1_g1~~TRINITY_DN15923_c1_g1_i2.p2  ORF type:complete len:144 (-),score=24.07 TRINITY_DN15923_c1_g1_i2:340-723(-)
MSANPSQRCFELSWNTKLPAAIFFVIVYILVFPGISLWIFFSQKRGSCDSLLAPLLSHLLVPYRKEVQFWEWVKLVYKLAFVMVRDVGFLSSDTRQIVAVFIIIILLCLEILWTPFVKRVVNIMSIL